MYYSLQKLAKLTDETVLYPGHNYAEKPTSTLGEQKLHNMYLRLSSKSLPDFLSVMS
jgi:hypothetical protein